jgi:hypothetical protein
VRGIVGRRPSGVGGPRRLRRTTHDARLATLVLVALAAAACSNDHLLTGKYRLKTGSAPVTLPGVTGFDAMYLELVVGQYGSDVAGCLHFYGSAEQSPPPPPFCEARHFVSGGYDGRLTFSVWSPASCATGVQTTDTLLGVFQVLDTAGDELSGTLTAATSGTSAKNVAFERVTQASDLTSQDKACTEAAQGTVPAADAVDADAAGGDVAEPGRDGGES